MHEPGGKYTRQCAFDECGVTFSTNNIRRIFHSDYCRAAAANKRYYARNRHTHILRVMLQTARRKLRQRAANTQSTVAPAPVRKTVKAKPSAPDFDNMTPEQILEWVRENPDKVNPRR